MDFIKAHEIAKSVIQRGKKRIVTQEEQDVARKTYRFITGKAWKGCTDCWQKLYVLTDIEIMKSEEEIKNPKPMSQFKLKANKIIQMHGFDPIGEKNLTDEKAINILRSSKKHIKNFDEFPENWEALVNGVSESKEDVVIDVSPQVDKVIEDSKEEVKEKLEGMPKKELVKICEAYQYPVKEYEKLNKDKLVDYLLKKQFA